jgi:hypothetical protein
VCSGVEAVEARQWRPSGGASGSGEVEAEVSRIQAKVGQIQVEIGLLCLPLSLPWRWLPPLWRSPPRRQFRPFLSHGGYVGPRPDLAGNTQIRWRGDRPRPNPAERRLVVPKSSKEEVRLDPARTR